jgi:hypothetical protein
VRDDAVSVQRFQVLYLMTIISVAAVAVSVADGAFPEADGAVSVAN